MKTLPNLWTEHPTRGIARRRRILAERERVAAQAQVATSRRPVPAYTKRDRVAGRVIEA